MKNQDLGAYASETARARTERARAIAAAGGIEQALAKRRQFQTLDEFLVAEVQAPSKGTRLEREGDVVYQYYDPRSGFQVRCFCSLWRGLGDDEEASLTWCQCSKGFVMKLWEAYVGSPVKVDLVESCIAGAEECKFAVHL